MALSVTEWSGERARGGDLACGASAFPVWRLISEG